MKASTARWMAMVFLCLAGASADDARFASTAAGISLDRPAGWTTIATRDLTAQASTRRLGDEQLLDAIKPLDGKPLVEFAKHAEPYPDLNPSIQVNLRALGGFATRPIAEVLSTIVIPLRRLHPDLELVGPTKDVKISGLKGLEATTAYTLQVDGRDVPVRSRIWVVPRGSLYFVIGMTDPPKGSDVSDREFKAALASIQIDP